ncbi:MAG: hypothetical protein K2X38_03405 [Gemmataceae bacterium]|nr:hypothetical protein [Gemmataceae bacterium]
MTALHQELETPPKHRSLGSGWISGTIALLLAIIGLGAVLCLRDSTKNLLPSQYDADRTEQESDDQYHVQREADERHVAHRARPTRSEIADNAVAKPSFWSKTKPASATSSRSC